MVGQFDSVISGALGSVTDMFSLFDTITNMTVILEDLENLPIAGELTLGGVERYRYCARSFLSYLSLYPTININIYSCQSLASDQKTNFKNYAGVVGAY